ncbi:MAG TPA: hypothetical protein VKM54_06230 [Myxococcota bacterium]|nr:hypothetical protein [Myxococcota bacterium]
MTAGTTRHLWAVLGLACAVASCAKPPRVVPPVAKRIARTCEVSPLTIERHGNGWEDKITLPATGRFAVEPHLAAREDAFGKEPFPKTVAEGIEPHLGRSCAKLQPLGARPDCSDVYLSEDLRQFMPGSDDAAIGQGARGTHKPSADEEMWLIDMAFAPGHRARAGQRWLLSANGRRVVAIAGYEARPLLWKFLGGAPAELHWYLGSDEGSQITLLGPLKDQTLVPGPIVCP